MSVARASPQPLTRAAAKNQVSSRLRCVSPTEHLLTGGNAFPSGSRCSLACCSPPLVEQRIRSLFLSPLASSRCPALRLQPRRNQSSRSMPQAVGRPGDVSGRGSSVFCCQQFLTAFPAVHGLERFAGARQAL